MVEGLTGRGRRGRRGGKRRYKQRDTGHSGTHTHIYMCQDALALLKGGPHEGVRQESDT